MMNTAVFWILMILVASAMAKDTHKADGGNVGEMDKIDGDQSDHQWPYNGVFIGKRTLEPIDGLRSKDTFFGKPATVPDDYREQDWVEETKLIARYLTKLVASVVTMAHDALNAEKKIVRVVHKPYEGQRKQWPKSGILIG